MPRISIEGLRVEADLSRNEQQEILGGFGALILPQIEQDNLSENGSTVERKSPNLMLACATGTPI
jgi:hypothetical protein